MTPALRTRDLAVGYRTRRVRRAVLEHVNLAVRPGELVCLLGPNGIGKSTLLRTLARMQPALWGGIELGGSDLRSITHIELARRLGVVLTERVAVEALPVRRIVELGRYPHSGWFGRITDRDRKAVDWAIDAVGVRHLADRDFSRLSDGERQRVMIGRALAQEPVLLVLDEPTAFLDVPSRVELMGLLRQLTREGPLAVVVSTHDLELALRTADVVWLVMPGGELVTGAPEDVVLTGGLAQAFEGRQIRFHPEERSFKLLTGDCGDAVVHGSGLRASLATAVLEREGYAVTPGAAAYALAVHAHESGWRVTADDTEWSGADFASLAACLRERRTAS
jgi:iron complex transport system ATP-binding protein